MFDQKKKEIDRAFQAQLFQKMAHSRRVGMETGKNMQAAEREALRQIGQAARGEIVTKSGEDG